MDDKSAKAAFAAGKNFSDEQQRLLDQVEIIARDAEMKPGGQPYRRSYDAVDKKTGETIDSRDIEKRKDDVVRAANGRVVAPEEALMEKEGWGRIVPQQPAERTWKVNLNAGIRTKGDDALVIKLVETNGKHWGKERRSGGEDWPTGESRRWEYQISRKGQDASKPENVLKIPVFSNFGAGIFTEIGNKGSSYTSENMTTKNFQAQRVLRKADDIEIIVPSPTSYGVALAILDRDPFDAFAGKKALRGGRVTIPEGSLDLVSGGFRSSLVQIKGGDKNWGEITYTHGLSLDDVAKSEKANEGKLYAKNPIPQDELQWREAGADTESAKRTASLSMPAIDGEGMIKEGATVSVSGNTGTGANLTVDGKGMSIPPHNVFSNEAKGAWSSPPVWLHGPGNKGSVDVSGLDGRIVISGGGKILTSQVTPNCWWYAEVILTGGSKTEKAVYTIEIPQFDDPKKKLDWVKKGPRDFKLERYPMQPYESIPLVYPDGSAVQMGQTENDEISIRGSNIEVRVKRGDQVETIYDSDKPELNKQSSLQRKPNGDVVLGGIGLAALAGADGQGAVASRRQFLAGAASSLAAMLARGGSEAPQEPQARQLEVRQPLVAAPDPVSSPLSVLMPDLREGKDGHLAVIARAPIISMVENKVASRG